MSPMHRSLFARLQFAALILLAPDDGGAAGGAGEGEPPAAGESTEGTPPAGTEGAADEGKPAGKTFTQAEVAEMVAKERTKATKAAEAEAAKAAERAKLDETERLKAEKADAETAAEARIAAANARLIAADAKAAALDAGVKPDRVGAFLRLVDTGAIAVSDDGEVDAKALKSAVTDALKVVPEFKASAATGQLGGDMNGTGAKPKPSNLEEAVNARLAG